VSMNIVAFRFNPGGLDDEALDQLNQKLGDAVLADGRFLSGTSKIGPRTIFRLAFSNWRTREQDVEEFADVVIKSKDDIADLDNLLNGMNVDTIKNDEESSESYYKLYHQLVE